VKMIFMDKLCKYH